MERSVLDRIRAVVFDFDGTLADTRIDFARMRKLIVEHLRSFGLCEPGCEDKRYILEIIAGAKQELVDRPEVAERYQAETAQILEQVELEACSISQPFPGVPEALRRLADCGYRLGIVTRNCRTVVRLQLERWQVSTEVLLTRDDLDRVKPDPEHLLAALLALKVRPQRAALVGDHPTDIECARRAGALAVGVLTDKTTREEHLAAGADLVVDDVPAFVRLLCDGG